MRDIKFRGYNGMDWIYSRSIDIEKENDNYYMFNYENGEWEMVNRVGQYTGLKDEDGKEIYEGDIVDIQELRAGIRYPKYRGEVVFSDGSFCVDTGTSKHFRWMGYEVVLIGNVFDMPDWNF